MNFVTHALVFQYSVILNFVCFSLYLKGLLFSCVHWFCLWEVLTFKVMILFEHMLKLMPHRNRVMQGDQHFCVWCLQNCILTQLSVVQAEGCSLWKITFFKSWFVSRLSGAPLLDKVLWLFWGINILLWAPPPPHNRTDKATSIYRC